MKTTKTKVDHLFQYEQLPKAVSFLEDAFSQDIKLQNRNVSLKRNYDLSPQVEARLRDKCALDFDIWENARL